MSVTLMQQESTAIFDRFASVPEPGTVVELDHGDEAEVLEFLARRPIHTVFMASQIRDNGLLSPHNRGSFYACRDRHARLEGVALIGHATLIEARTENALASFARLASNCMNAALIRGEEESVNNFWAYYADSGQKPRLSCRELLLEQRAPQPAGETVDLRPATLNDLEKVAAVNASMVFEECRISPLRSDPGGFRLRTARRIEQGRVWVWIQDNRLIFKADVVGNTPEVAYLEGVQVHAEERGQGYGTRCLAALSSILLQRSQSISLTINERNKQALKFFENAGYKFHSLYETIYLR